MSSHKIVRWLYSVPTQYPLITTKAWCTFFMVTSRYIIILYNIAIFPRYWKESTMTWGTTHNEFTLLTLNQSHDLSLTLTKVHLLGFWVCRMLSCVAPVVHWYVWWNNPHDITRVIWPCVHLPGREEPVWWHWVNWLNGFYSLRHAFFALPLLPFFFNTASQLYRGALLNTL